MTMSWGPKSKGTTRPASARGNHADAEARVVPAAAAPPDGRVLRTRLHDGVERDAGRALERQQTGGAVIAIADRRGKTAAGRRVRGERRERRGLVGLIEPTAERRTVVVDRRQERGRRHIEPPLP